MKEDKNLEKFAVDEEKLEKVDGGADRIKGGKKKLVMVSENLGGHKVDDDLGVLVSPAKNDI